MSETEKKCCENGAGGCCGHRRGARIVVIIVGLVLLAAVIVTALLRDRLVSPSYRQVTITGQGRVAYTPDLAVVTLGVQIDKVAKADEALNQLNVKMDSIIKAVKALGVTDDNIQTQNYSLYPQYDYKDNVSSVSGYNANEQLVIKVTGYDKDQNKLNQVIAAASKAGANQVNNLVFDASNLNDIKQEARLKAISDAKSKSTALAEAAGVKLKSIAGWYENMVTPVPMYVDYAAKGGMGAGGGAIDAQTPSGSREVVIEIGVNYNIK
jgi:hypothetical protein